MALPDSTNLSSLDFAYQGSPFAFVEAKAGQDTGSLNYVYQALPFFAAPYSSSTPTDPYIDDVVALLHFNASGTSIVDEITSNTWTTVGSATQSTSSPLWGSGSLSIPDTSSNIVTTTTPANFNFGTGDFTVEMAIEFNSTQTATWPVPIEFAHSTDIVWQIYFDNYTGSQPYMVWWCPSNNVSGMTHATLKAWEVPGTHYLAYSRVSGVGYLYFDGTRVGTGADTIDYTGGTQLLIGREFNGDNGVPGKNDEVRITKGVGRYTGTSYDIQTAEFPNPSAPPTDVTGTIAATEGADTGALTGTLTVTGSIGATEGRDTPSLTGTLTASGVIAATEGRDSAALIGSVLVTGAVAATEGADAGSLSGVVGDSVAGVIAATEGADTASVSGVLTVTGVVGAIEGKDVAALSGYVPPPITGVIAAVEGRDGAAITGLVGNGNRVVDSDGDYSHMPTVMPNQPKPEKPSLKKAKKPKLKPLPKNLSKEQLQALRDALQQTDAFYAERLAQIEALLALLIAEEARQAFEQAQEEEEFLMLIEMMLEYREQQKLVLAG